VFNGTCCFQPLSAILLKQKASVFQDMMPPQEARMMSEFAANKKRNTIEITN